MPRHASLVMTDPSQAGRVGITAGSIVVMRDDGFDRIRSTRPLFGGSLLDSREIVPLLGGR